MSYKYHVNPNTGVPGRCRAKEGNCPYGGADSHFDTYSEAQQHAQSNLESKHGLLPSSELDKAESIIEETLTKQEKYKSYFDGMTEKEVCNELRNTKDEDLVMGVINQELFTNEKDNSRLFAALENPNISREFIEDVTNNPVDYNYETQRHLMNNKSLTHKDLMTILQKSDDIYTQTLVHRNPGLSRKYVEYMFENHKDKLKTLPFLGVHSNHAVNDIFGDWYVTVQIEEGLPDRSKLNNIVSEYPYWHWEG